jgi:hypothetical protein
VAIQAAFMASSFVLVDDAFIGHTVENRNTHKKKSIRFLIVFLVDGFNNNIVVCKKQRTQAGGVAATLLSLFCTFFGGR